MKREGNLIERIAHPDNLRLAFWKARKGKAGKRDVEAFRGQLDANLLSLREELLAGNVRVGDYRYFTILDPKERLICAAAFRERVLHHALMNICHHVFERFQTEDSYATRIGKGQYAALDRARDYTRRYGWFCKLDVRKFFDNIDHEVLFAKLCRIFKDPQLLAIFRQIIDSYAVSPGKGLPIGNLTSQYFANFYLGYADHYVREVLHCTAYVRYMDDMVLWHSDKSELLRQKQHLCAYILSELALPLKPACINTVNKGLPFLGYVLFPDRVRLNKHSKKRFARKYKHYNNMLSDGTWAQGEFSLHVQPLIAFTRYADATAYRRLLVERTESDHKQATTACFAGAAGTTTPRTAAPPTGTTTIPTMRTTTSGSAWSSPFSSKRPVDAGYGEPAGFHALLPKAEHLFYPHLVGSRRRRPGMDFLRLKTEHNIITKNRVYENKTIFERSDARGGCADGHGRVVLLLAGRG